MISRLCCPVTERRLRPIYDYLDNGNNKKALQEADKVLKKQPNLLCAKVLKCLALSRLGKETDCVDNLELIKKERPVDESTLQLMTVCYRDINKPDLICQLYENASKADPTNEEILNNLFISYVRVGEYKKQQLTALSLNKHHPKSQYYFWAIISSLLQSVEKIADLLEVFSEPIFSPHICSKDRPYAYNYLMEKVVVQDPTKIVNVKVAGKMFEKLLSERKLENEQELMVYLALLDMMDKHEEALQVLSSPHEMSLLDSMTLLNLKLSVLAKLKRWMEINVLVKAELDNGLDGWNYFLYYIDSAFELDKDHCEKYYLEAEEFIASLAKSSLGLKKRGPYLARLELCSRFSKFDNVLDYLVEYFREFGTREVCVHDLKPYLHHLSPENCSDFLRLIREPSKSFDARMRMDYHISHEEFARLMACKKSDRRVYVAQLMQYFIDALEFNADLPSTEMRSSDRYALLALFTLHDLWLETNLSNYIIEAITICHYCLFKSPSNSQFKLLLLKFYHLLGSSESAHMAYVSLDVKHMQLDTLGYLHVMPLICTASHVNANLVMNLTLKFFNTNKKESADHITFAYKYEAYTKIPEMIAIKEKQNNSIHYHLVEVERMLLIIFASETYENTLNNIKYFNVIPQVDQIPWSLLEDNRDFKVLWDLEPKSRSITNEEILVSRNFDITYLSLRSRLLRIIVACVNLGSESLEGINIDGSDDNGGGNSFLASKNILLNLIYSLEEDVEKMKNNPPKPIQKSPSISAPPKSRLPLIHSQNYFDILLNGLWFLLSLVPGAVPGKEMGEEECKYRLGNIMMLSERFALSLSLKSTDVTKREEMIQICSLFVEIASASCIFVGVGAAILSKLKTIITKKIKKKKDSQKIDLPNELQWRTNLLSQFIIYAADTIKNMYFILKSEEKMLTNDITKYGDFELYNTFKQKDESVMNHIEWTELESFSNSANENIVNSHKSSVNTMSLSLNSKLKYLSSIKI